MTQTENFQFQLKLFFLKLDQLKLLIVRKDAESSGEIGGGEAAGTVAGLDFEVLDCFAD